MFVADRCRRRLLKFAMPSEEHAPGQERRGAADHDEANLHQLNEVGPYGPRPTGRGWTRGERIVVIAGVLLVVDLLLAPWHRVSLSPGLEEFGIEVPSLTYDRSAVEDPESFLGRAALVIAAAMVLHVLATKVVASLTRWKQIHLLAGPAVLGLLVAKLIANAEFLGLGAWAAVGLASILAYGGYLISQESTYPSRRRLPWE